MMNAITVVYNPFTMESQVFILKDNEEQQTKVYSEIEQLAEALTGLAYGHGIYNIKIDSPISIDGLSEKIHECEASIYSNNKIKIEGI